MRRLFAVRATGDSDAVANLFSETEHFVAVGNEDGEIWHGARARALVADNWGRLAEESDEVVQVAAFESGSVGWQPWKGGGPGQSFPLMGITSRLS